jgi:hypothetical protein
MDVSKYPKLDPWKQQSGRWLPLFTPLLSSARLISQRKGTEMARPQTPFTAKPAKQRNTSRDKMRMGYDRMRREIKRTEADQAKAAATQTAKRGRK